MPEKGKMETKKGTRPGAGARQTVQPGFGTLSRAPFDVQIQQVVFEGASLRTELFDVRLKLAAGVNSLLFCERIFLLLLLLAQIIDPPLGVPAEFLATTAANLAEIRSRGSGARRTNRFASKVCFDGSQDIVLPILDPSHGRPGLAAYNFNLRFRGRNAFYPHADVFAKGFRTYIAFRGDVALLAIGIKYLQIATLGGIDCRPPNLIKGRAINLFCALSLFR